MKRRSMLPTLLFVLVGSHLGDGAQLPPPITSEALKDYCISSRWGFTCLANSRAGPFLPRSRLLMAGAAASVSIRATLWDLGPCDLARASPALANPKGVFDTRLRSPWRCTTRCQRRISSCCSMPGARDHSRLPHVTLDIRRFDRPAGSWHGHDSANADMKPCLFLRPSFFDE